MLMLEFFETCTDCFAISSGARNGQLQLHIIFPLASYAARYNASALGSCKLFRRSHVLPPGGTEAVTTVPFFRIFSVVVPSFAFGKLTSFHSNLQRFRFV